MLLPYCPRPASRDKARQSSLGLSNAVFEHDSGPNHEARVGRVSGAPKLDRHLGATELARAATELAITERGHGACRHGSVDPGRGDVRERHCEGRQRPAGASRRAGTRLGAGGGSSESTGPEAENTTGGDGNEWSTFFCAWRASSSEVRANGSLRCDAATARAANPTAHHFGLMLNRARARAPQWPSPRLSWHLGLKLNRTRATPRHWPSPRLSWPSRRAPPETEARSP